MKRILDSALAIASIASLTGCGGGGGSAAALTSAPTPVTATYKVGGSITGLNGTVVLQNNGGDDLSLESNGAFEFATAASGGANFNVTVKSQPRNPTQVCTVSGGTGAIANENVSSINVSCVLVPLTLVSSTPANGAIGVARDASLTLNFSATLDPTFPASAIALTSTAGAQTIATTVSGSMLTITPSNKLSRLSAYTLTLATSLRGSGGELLAKPVAIDFNSADGAWSAPTLLETDDAGDALSPRVATDLSGNAVAIWYQWDGVHSNIVADRFAVATGWDGPVLVEQSDLGDARDPEFAFDGNGNGLAVWAQTSGSNYNAWASRFYGAGTFGPPVRLDLSTYDAWLPQVSFDPLGNAFAMWSQLQVRASSYSPATGWTGTSQIVSDAFKGGYAPQLCFDGQGAALAVWEVFNSGKSTKVEVWSNRFVPGLGWGTAALLDAKAQVSDRDSRPQIACNPAGEAIALWTRSDTGGNVLASRFSPQSGWSAAMSLEDNAYIPTNVSLAMDGQGNAIAAWMLSDSSRLRIRANRFSASGGWGSTTSIDSDGADAGPAQYPHVAMNSGGNAVVVWQQSIGGASTIAATRYIAGEGWMTARIVDNAAQGPNYHPHVALDRFDNAIAVWEKVSAGRYSIAASRFE